MKSDVEEKGKDFETIPLGYIVQAKPLLESINLKNKEIAGIKKLKQLNQSSENLKRIDSELNEADEKKHILVTQLSAIREFTNEEFAYKYQFISNETTKLEAKIKGTHGDVNEYNQSRIKLSQTQNEHISLIQNNIEFEKILVNHSKDKDLQDKAETHLYHLYNDELGLQEKRLAALEEKNELIKLNSHLYDKESNEKQSIESFADIKSCEGRISLLENEIEIKEKPFQYEINPFYGQEQPTTADPTTKSKPLSESEKLKQQMQKLDRLNIETYKQIQDQQLSSAERATLLDELKANELSQKEIWDRLAEIQKEKLDVPVVDSNNSKPIESTQTKNQGAVPKNKLISEPDSKPTQQQQLEDLLKAQPKKANRLEDSTDQQSTVPNTTFRNELEQKLQERQKKKAMQGTSTSTFFSSVSSSTSRDKTKTQEKETKRKEFSR